ncbi:hypothetical protein J7M23_01130 [Candidatus Sumerlaeota bacterium]|nr:hypothetical protein [Candidatus Sumerlaeota bacterium]
MKLFSLEAFRAFFLKLLGCTYQEIGALHDLAPRSIKYHVQAIRSSYPDAKNFFLEKVTEVPEKKEEKVRLATKLAQEYLDRFHQKIKQFSEHSEPSQPPQQIQQIQPTASSPPQSTPSQPVSQVPQLLLEAIDRSVSTYYEKQQQDISNLEFEKEEQPQPSKQDDKIFLIIILITFAFTLPFVFLTASSKSKNSQPSQQQPFHQQFAQRKILRLSQLGI